MCKHDKSTKLDVPDISHCPHIRTKPWPQVTCKENMDEVFEICKQTDKQTDRQRNRDTQTC